MTDTPTNPTSPDHLAKTAMRLGPSVLASKAVGFFIPPVIAVLFGVSYITDAFFYALAVPTFLIVLSTNAVGTIATPVLARTQKRTPQRLSKVTGQLALAAAFFGCGLGLFVSLIYTLYLPEISKFSTDTSALAIHFLFLLLPLMTALGLNNILRASCEVQGLFQIPVWAGLIRSLVVLGLLWGLHEVGPYSLPVAFSIGETFRTGVLWMGLRYRGHSPTLCFSLLPETRATLKVLSPLLASEILVASPIIVDKLFASWLESGQVSILEYADRFRLIPQLLIEGTLLPVAFATWANLHAEERREELIISARETFWWCLRWVTPPLVLLWWWREPLIAWIYQWGEFSGDNVQQTAELVTWFLPGVAALMLGALAYRIHILDQRFLFILSCSALAGLTNIGLNALLVQSHGLWGIALASAIVWSGLAIAYLAAVRKPKNGEKRLPAAQSVIIVICSLLGPACLFWLEMTYCFPLLIVALIGMNGVLDRAKPVVSSPSRRS